MGGGWVIILEINLMLIKHLIKMYWIIFKQQHVWLNHEYKCVEYVEILLMII